MKFKFILKEQEIEKYKYKPDWVPTTIQGWTDKLQYDLLRKKNIKVAIENAVYFVGSINIHIYKDSTPILTLFYKGPGFGEYSGLLIGIRFFRGSGYFPGDRASYMSYDIDGFIRINESIERPIKESKDEILFFLKPPTYEKINDPKYQYTLWRKYGVKIIKFDDTYYVIRKSDIDIEIGYYNNHNLKEVEYWLGMERHRENGPALISYNNNGIKIREEYWIIDERHRKDGPAIIRYNNNGIKVHEGYWIMDARHREDGPAIIHYDDNGKKIREKYYINGTKISEDSFYNRK